MYALCLTRELKDISLNSIKNKNYSRLDLFIGSTIIYA